MLERAIDLATDDLIARIRAGDEAARAELRKLVAKEIAPITFAVPKRETWEPTPYTPPVVVPFGTGDPPPWYRNPTWCGEGSTITKTTAQTGLVCRN